MGQQKVEANLPKITILPILHQTNTNSSIIRLSIRRTFGKFVEQGIKMKDNKSFFKSFI